MKPAFARLARRLIRWQLARVSPEKLLRMGEHRLLTAFQRAAKHSPAYRTLLSESSVDPAAIRTAAQFVASCPILEKSNTFRRFRLAELIAQDISSRNIASILTSSGHGGGGFALGLSTRDQMQAMPWDIDFGLDLAFDIDRNRTLLINCLPMGVTFQSNTVCVANVSVREDMVCAIVEQAGNLFDQIILCGDPLFLKRLCDYSESHGVAWDRHRMHVIVGEETFSESFRDYLAATLHIDPDAPGSGLIGSSMGVGELGLNLFNETRETVALRRTCARNRGCLVRLLGHDNAGVLPTFFVYNPLRTYVEVHSPDSRGCGDLIVSMLDAKAVIPLMRYKTGDRATLLDPTCVAGLLGADMQVPALPMVAILGRAKDVISPQWHVDFFKDVLYRRRDIARQLTGAFRLTRSQNAMRWELQLNRESKADSGNIASALMAEIGDRSGDGGIEVTCYTYQSFPYGQALDFERKFIYWEG